MGNFSGSVTRAYVSAASSFCGRCALAGVEEAPARAAAGNTSSITTSTATSRPHVRPGPGYRACRARGHFTGTTVGAGRLNTPSSTAASSRMSVNVRVALVHGSTSAVRMVAGTLAPDTSR